MSIMPNGAAIRIRGWIKPHIFNLGSRGGAQVYICFNDMPAGPRIERIQGFGKTIREAYQAWLENGGSTQ